MYKYENFKLPSIVNSDLVVFPENKRAKKILDRDKRMVKLLQQTQANSVIVWKKNNPLLYSFKSPLKNKKYDNNLLFFVDDYLDAAEKKYKGQIAITEKALPIEPKIEKFGNKPVKEKYPSEPILQKGEFEKKKDFQVRTKKALAQWREQKDTIDVKYSNEVKKYKETQKLQYTTAHSNWLINKKKTEDDNAQLRLKHQKQLDLMSGYRDYWLWQAALVSLGTKEFTFEKLQYNSENEHFEYIVKGGVLNFRFEGTIAIPIAQAKEFKEYATKSLGILFKIKDNKLFITDFIYKEKPSGYDATSKTKLVLLDKKQLKLERKRVADDIAKEKKRVADAIAKKKYLEHNRIFYDKTTKLMWQDTKDAKTIGKSWSDARKYCQNLTLRGYHDWSLSSLKELNGLYMKKYELKNVASSGYWSSSEGVSRSSNAWVVYFDSGDDTSSRVKSCGYFVRCVRGRQ